MRFRSPFPMLACRHLSETIRFYRDLLGFRETYRFPDDGPPSFVVLELDGRELGLGTTERDTIHGRPFGTRAGHFFEMCLATDDLDAALVQLRGAGVKVLVEPVEQPWGERIAYVCDPEDHPVMLTEISAPSEASEGDA